jgi:hypothetical protein
MILISDMAITAGMPLLIPAFLTISKKHGATNVNQ